LFVYGYFLLEFCFAQLDGIWNGAKIIMLVFLGGGGGDIQRIIEKMNNRQK